MPSSQMHNVRQGFPERVLAVDVVDLTVQDSEFMVPIGPPATKAAYREVTRS